MRAVHPRQSRRAADRGRARSCSKAPRRILRDVERTGDEIRAQDAHPSGKIILGVTPTLCPVLVPELFAACGATIR